MRKHQAISLSVQSVLEAHAVTGGTANGIATNEAASASLLHTIVKVRLCHPATDDQAAEDAVVSPDQTESF